MPSNAVSFDPFTRFNLIVHGAESNSSHLFISTDSKLLLDHITGSIMVCSVDFCYEDQARGTRFLTIQITRTSIVTDDD